ncbi:hypothetical protein F5882DRAFT_423206 [Hyaloscypha sp. PMI_1271]|nr:hypothetical protein F5882DRAFT_423206 [Hyaloscypha sp. PMI_1271]
MSPSLTGKRAARSSRANGLRFSNFGANSAITFSNQFLPMWPCFVFAISVYIPVYQPRSIFVFGLISLFGFCLAVPS